MIVSALERMFARFAGMLHHRSSLHAKCTRAEMCPLSNRCLHRGMLVTLVYIDGHEVERLAAEDLGTPSQHDLLRCVVNIDEVAPLLATLGQRYKGEKGEAAAATKIAVRGRAEMEGGYGMILCPKVRLIGVDRCALCRPRGKCTGPASSFWATLCNVPQRLPSKRCGACTWRASTPAKRLQYARDGLLFVVMPLFGVGGC